MKINIVCTILAVTFLPVILIGCSPAGNVKTGSTGSDEVSRFEEVKLYFIQVADGMESAVPVTREIDGGQCIIESALLSLLDGVTDGEKSDGYSSSIPAGTELISFEVQSGVALCDFSGEIEPGGGAAWVTAIRSQITKTLRQFDEVERVEIMVESRKEDVLQP